jgi:hypothetical protein
MALGNEERGSRYAPHYMGSGFGCHWSRIQEWKIGGDTGIVILFG